MADTKPVGLSDAAQTTPQTTINCSSDDAPPPAALIASLISTPPAQKGEDWTISVDWQRFDLQRIEQSVPGEPCILVEIDRYDADNVVLSIPDPFVGIGQDDRYVRVENGPQLVILPMATNFRGITLWMNFNEPVVNCIGEAGRLGHRIDLGGWNKAKLSCQQRGLSENDCTRLAESQCSLHNVALRPVPPTLSRQAPRCSNPPQKTDTVK